METHGWKHFQVRVLVKLMLQSHCGHNLSDKTMDGSTSKRRFCHTCCHGHIAVTICQMKTTDGSTSKCGFGQTQLGKIIYRLLMCNWSQPVASGLSAEG